MFLLLFFYIFTDKSVNKYNFNLLVCILPGTITRDLGTERVLIDREYSKTVIFVLIIAGLEILDTVKHLPNGSAAHDECVIKTNDLRLCSSRFEVESINIISTACWILLSKINLPTRDHLWKFNEYKLLFYTKMLTQICDILGFNVLA